MFGDYRTRFASKFVVFVNIPMSNMRSKSVSLLQIVFSCMHLHSCDSRYKKKPLNARSGGRQHRIIREVQMFFSDSDPTHLKALVIGKVAGQTLQTTQKRGRRFLSDDAEREGVILVPEVQPKQS